MTSPSKPEILWAYVDDGGLVTAVIPGLGMVPLVTNKEKLAGLMSTVARQHAVTHQKPVSLVCYRLAAIVQTFEPGDV